MLNAADIKASNAPVKAPTYVPTTQDRHWEATRKAGGK